MNPPGKQIGFLGPTVGRRSAYLVRQAAKKIGLPLVVIGRNLEGDKFWDGVQVQERSFGPDCLEGLGLLLAPAVTEYKPRVIMRALQRGMTVFATEACGLPAREKLHWVDPFNADALAQDMAAWYAR